MNNTSSSNISSLQPEVFTHNVPALVFGVSLIIVIICGNVLVCLSVYKEKALKTTTNYFIVSLAVADLLLAVLVLPLFVYAEVSHAFAFIEVNFVEVNMIQTWLRVKTVFLGIGYYFSLQF